MVVLLSLVTLLSLASSSLSLPWPWPPRQSPGTVQTLKGLATGTLDTSGAYRYAVKYASANRWEPSSVATSWQLPNNSTDPSALPLTCPQPGVDDSTFSEDCLSLLLYVPPSVSAGSNAPTFLWIHGGSFIQGSATDPGLDGSALAVATNSIVAVAQYRLGPFGWLTPNGETNLGLKDIVAALDFLHEVLPSFGGSTSSVTIAGQSSGGTMIRGLLAAPSVSSLFQSAIIQSDPMDYGFLSPQLESALVSAFVSSTNCTDGDISCFDALSVDDIINAGVNVFDNAGSIAPATGQGEPIRMVYDGSFITSPLDSTAPFPYQSKSLILSTVLNEAALSIYSAFTSPVPEDEFTLIVNATFGEPRTDEIVDSPYYAAGNNTDARVQLQVLGTDYLWKCSTWSFAREWVKAGGEAYVGLYVVGASYPGNSAVPICTEPGEVCHQDDIEIVFGTVPSPTAAQAALTTEMQARYGAFFRTGNPNPGGSVSTWPAATGSSVNAIELGGSGIAPIDACASSFWGEEVQYDYQYFDL